MNELSRNTRWLGICIVLFAIGCGANPLPSSNGKTTVVEPVSDNPNPTRAAESVSIPDSEMEVTSADAINNDSALASVTRTLKAIEAGDLAAAYEFLPFSYQQDVDGLIHEFATTMDPTVWTTMFDILAKSAQVLGTKKEFLWSLDLFQDKSEWDPLKDHWDDCVAVLRQFATGPCSDITLLTQSTAKSLLSASGSSIVPMLDAMGLGISADLSRQFSGISVKQIRVSESEQVLGFDRANDEHPLEISYTKHHGHWLPTSLIEHWQTGITADRAWLATLPELITHSKPRILDILGNAEAILDQLLAAPNREEFQQAAGPAILSLALAWTQVEALSERPLLAASTGRRGTVTINRELSESELLKLVEQILRPLQASGNDYTLLANDGRTVCRLTSISNIEFLKMRFAEFFQIPVEGIQVDEATGAIKIELPR